MGPPEGLDNPKYGAGHQDVGAVQCSLHGKIGTSRGLGKVLVAIRVELV